MSRWKTSSTAVFNLSYHLIWCPKFVVGQLKGYTGRILRQEFPKLKSRLPTLWTRSYYIDSVGKLNEHTIRKYVQDQKNK